MPIILGIESTAHTFGVGVVMNGKILSNVKRSYTTEQGGIIPTDAAKHHCENKNEIYFEALDASGIKEENIDAVAFSQGPGLAPCLIEGMKFAKELATRFDNSSTSPNPPTRRVKNKIKPRLFGVPLIPVNHCIAHLEIGRITGAKDPVMLYASGANTQIIAYASGKYRIFGETLDIGVGNFIDSFARYAGIGFPGGPVIAKLAEEGKNYFELPYKVKGMDIALSGILTNLREKLGKISPTQLATSHEQLIINNTLYHEITRPPEEKIVNEKKYKDDEQLDDNLRPLIKFQRSALTKFGTKQLNSERSEAKYSLADLAYSMQETVFAMLVETAERALAHTGKKELLLGGGVACNTRLQEMCRIMCKERGAKLFVPENSLLVDNAGMISYLGEIMFKAGVKEKNFEKIDIKPRQRTDDVQVGWR